MAKEVITKTVSALVSPVAVGWACFFAGHTLPVPLLVKVAFLSIARVLSPSLWSAY
jgi:hypothetical protein